MDLLLTNKLDTSNRLRNIFKAPAVAEHFCASRHIPSEILSKISSEVLSEIIRVKGRQPSYKILEVGTGAGRLALPFATELIKQYPGSKLYGIDNSQSMIKEAGKHISDQKLIDYRHDDITDTLPFDADFFDASISFYVYHCIKQWKKAIANVTDVLIFPKILIFLREHSQWGYHLDNRFTGIEITDTEYCEFWQEYFKQRQLLSSLPKVDISASNIDKLTAHLKQMGFLHEYKVSKTKWNRSISYAESLEFIELGLFTKLRVGLDTKQRHILKKEMSSWLNRNGINSFNEHKTVPAAIEIDIFYKED